MQGHEPSSTVVGLRCFLIAAVSLGMALGVALIWVLVSRHALYLFNPAELSEAQQALLPRTKEQAAPVSSGSPQPPTEKSAEAKHEAT